MPLIRRLAAHVHLLPATADNHFSQPGGLLQLGLETGFFSLQGTDAHIFSGRATISERRQLEPRWRLATFIGGLCSELHRTVNLVTATGTEAATHGTAGHPAAASPEVRAPWPALLLPLADWLQAGGMPSYRLHWHRDQAECRGLGLFVLPHVVPPATLQHLAAGNQVVVPHLLASIGGVSLLREHNVLDALVRRSLALVIDRQLRGQAVQVGHTVAGAHWPRYLVQAMQRLVATNASWLPNGDKSRVWWGPDGLYVLWPQAAADIRALLESDQLAGMPDTADAMLDALAASGMLAAQAGGEWLWPICPAGGRGTLQAVQLNVPEVLLSGADLRAEPLANRLTTVVPTRPEVPPPERAPEAEATRATPCEPARPASTLVTPAGFGSSDQAQAELFSDRTGQVAATSTASAPTAAERPAPPALPAATPLRLQAPMRLNPGVREALADIVATLNINGARPEAVVTDHGLFVPVTALQARGVQPAMAARALADAGMLDSAPNAGPPLQLRDIDGQSTLGLVVDARWIDGLTPC